MRSPGSMRARAAYSQRLYSSIGSFPGIITNAIVSFYVVSAMITSHRRLLDLLERINPLGKRATDIHVEQTDRMTAAMIRDQIVIALVRGQASALSLRLVPKEAAGAIRPVWQ